MPSATAFGTRVSHVTIGDRKLPVYCSGSGKFAILNAIDGTETELGDVEPLAKDSASIEAAAQKARAALAQRKIKVSVPFWFTDGRRGIAYGIHAGNGDVLVKDRSGTKERLRHYRGLGAQRATHGVLVADTDPKVVKRLLQLRVAIKKLQDEAEEIERWHSVDLQAAVREAIEKAETQSTSKPNEEN